MKKILGLLTVFAFSIGFSFSQKKTADGERFIIKLFDIDSISKAIKVLNDMNN